MITYPYITEYANKLHEHGYYMKLTLLHTTPTKWYAELQEVRTFGRTVTSFGPTSTLDNILYEIDTHSERMAKTL